MTQLSVLPLFNTEQRVALRNAAEGSGVFAQSVQHLRDWVEPWLRQPSVVPGHGEAGSQQHNRHQLNYQLIEGAGLLHLLTGEARYAEWVGRLLARYADLYLTMGFQPKRNTNPPGRIFHQMLNETMWLLYASVGYSYVKDALPADARIHIEQDLFDPMVELFTQTYAHDFDHIHNHGLWAVAAVGICGLAIGNDHYVSMAVDGLAGDRTSGGFLAQVSQLFSPDGYYVEGPYYHRFAIRPLCLFAEALHHHRPELDIYNFKNQVIRTTIRALLATAYPDGRLPALNDASRTMGIEDEGVVIAVAVHAAHFGIDAPLREIARRQQRVWVHPASIALAAAIDQNPAAATSCWPSVELCEGPDGTRGAQGFLRYADREGDVSQVVMAYGQHGMGHGHFDALGITWYNQGEEVLREYGFARWVNVESKFGGRYLPENKSYARQTVAHNCVVVDRRTQCGFDVAQADAVHGKTHFFAGAGTPVQAMSAFADDHYPGVRMQRSVFLIDLEEEERPLLVDLFRLCSEVEHEYDYALQYSGQVTSVSMPVEYADKCWNVVGDADGYEFLLQMARAPLSNGVGVTWLQGSRFNTWVTAASGGELLFTQTGANDPAFNLRRETGFLLRQRGKNHLFASAFSTHGFFDEANERCHGATSRLTEIRVLGHDEVGSVVRLVFKDRSFTLMVSNLADVSPDTSHTIQIDGHSHSWRGYFAILKD